MSTRALLLGYAVALLAGVGLGYWLHSPAPVAGAKVAHAQTVAAERHRDSVAVVVQHDTQTVVRLLPQLSLALTTLDVHDTASVTRLATAARAVAPACRDVVTSCAALHAADLTVIASQAHEIAALRPSRLGITAEGLYSYTTRTPLARAGLSVRVTSHLSAIAEAERGMLPRDSLHLRAGARWTF